MLTSAAKRFMLPFSAQKNREPEEVAAVFAVAEQNRNRGGGFFARQPQETIAFIAKVGYPLWLFPKNNTALIFDGLSDTGYSISYAETPSAMIFMGSLEANQRPQENYFAFLSNHASYFQQPPQEKQFMLKGLIADAEFRGEFTVYRREASELTASAALLLPTLEEQAISASLAEIDKLQMLLRADEEKLSECLRFIKKTTSQYLTELDYEAAAATEEADAKIKAQEELVNPQTAKLNKEYNHKIKDLTESFDKELGSLEKLRGKTEKFVEKTEADIRQYKHEAKAHGKKGHELYEKRWKEKIKKTEKELSGLKKELKKIDDKTKKITKQKNLEVSNLTFELSAKIKLIRQPLVDLEEARNAKMLAYKQESNRLLLMEKPIVEGIEKTMRTHEIINAAFTGLGFSDSQHKTPALLYVPFYTVCYELGLARRYLCVPPSTVRQVDFSSKLKGALGMSKTKDLLTPRFKTAAALVSQIELLTRQNSAFERQLWSLGDKNNLLKNSAFQANVKSGLVYLQNAGWLSQRETDDLNRQIKA
jgi:hypothetical protein